ncbi:MAG: hypothetical protein FWC56_04700 [Phycisphaerae bacterium]|nr:hypothetical protein [Phycisphaerae bacterium]
MSEVESDIDRERRREREEEEEDVGGSNMLAEPVATSTASTASPAQTVSAATGASTSQLRLRTAPNETLETDPVEELIRQVG